MSASIQGLSLVTHGSWSSMPNFPSMELSKNGFVYNGDLQ